MKPHRRKSVPPRRESDPEDVSRAAEGPAPEQPRPMPLRPPSQDEEPAPRPGHNEASQESPPPQYQEGASPAPAAGAQEPDYDPARALMDTDPYETSAPGPAPEQPVQDAPPGPPLPPPLAAGAGVYDEPPPRPPQASAPPAAAGRRRAGKPGRTSKAVKKVALQRGARPGAYRRPAPPSYGGGFSITTVFVGIVTLAMLWGAVMIMSPRDLSHIGGYPASPLGDRPSRNLLSEAQDLMISRTGEITFTEKEVNDYLNDRLQGEQRGMMSKLVEFKGVYLDFSPNLAEIIIEREIFGLRFVMSSKMRAERGRAGVSWRPAGWTLGRISLGERNLKPVIDMFLQLRNVCDEEYYTLQQMTNIRFEEGRVVLDAAL